MPKLQFRAAASAQYPLLCYFPVMVQEIVDSRNTIASYCRDLGVERLFVFGSATQGLTLADVRAKPQAPAWAPALRAQANALMIS